MEDDAAEAKNNMQAAWREYQFDQSNTESALRVVATMERAHKRIGAATPPPPARPMSYNTMKE